ncbi:MAG: hypothetical protein J4F29_22390 [Candidatus Latescibacteria bacterium]|nr:hypothetical protein [Candidatus Latescibacterota bacterium]MDE2799895.1 hypothetical protein [Gemmatimonadota bacterium]
MANIINPQSDSERLAKLEGLIEQIAQRLTSIENRLNNMESRLNNLENRMDKHFLWVVGLILTSWLSLATLILLKT